MNNDKNSSKDVHPKPEDREEEKIDLENEQSFPASDPPSHTPPREDKKDSGKKKNA